MADPKETYRAILEKGAQAIAPGIAPEIHIERPKNPEHGDLSSNVAMQLAKQLKRNPRELAQEFIRAVSPDLIESGFATAFTVAGAGFLNIKLNPAAKLQAIRHANEQGAGYGKRASPQPQAIQVEFVSANPTGPLHVGHGRQAALGDAIASLLEWNGWTVSREFYYNDAGVQIQNLALSVQARARGLKPGAEGWPESAYNGEYIQEIADDYLARKTVHAFDGEPIRASGKVDDLDAIRRFAVTCLRHEQDMDLQKFGVRFDTYYLESSLYTDGKVDATVQALVGSGHTYEKDGALWLRTTDFGDDKDRVMEVVVEDKQLSLAIGKKGQNVRLAAKLTGWRIDIRSDEAPDPRTSGGGGGSR